MPTARAFLNDLKWHQGRLDDATIWYVHRGAPGDEAAARGRDVLALRRSFFDLRDGASIPYHRVLRVEVDGAPVWQRRREEGAAAAPGSHGGP